MSFRLSGINPLSYMGVEPLTPPAMLVYDRAPTANDSQNVNIGSFWLYIDKSTNPYTTALYYLATLTGGVASWELISNSGGDVTDFDTDSGAVVPSSGLVNVLGGTLINTAGSGNTITVNADDSVAASFTADSGTATPVTNALTIAGGPGIVTSGSSATVTIEVDGDVATIFDADTGTATPSSNVIEILSGDLITTSASGNTITIDADDMVAGSYVTDTGTAVPAVNILNIVGGANVTTSGTGNTITIDASMGGGDLTFNCPGPTSATSSGGAIDFANGAGISITAAGTTVTIAATSTPTLASAFYAYQNTNGAGNTAAIYQMGAVIALTELYDIGGDFYPGDGAGTPASFTAPATGYYNFNLQVAASIDALSGTGAFPVIVLVTPSENFLGSVTPNVVTPGSNNGFRNNSISTLNSVVYLTAADVVTFKVGFLYGVTGTFRVLGPISYGGLGTCIQTFISGYQIG